MENLRKLKAVYLLCSIILLFGVITNVNAKELSNHPTKTLNNEAASTRPTNSSNHVSEELFNLIQAWKSTSLRTMELEEFVTKMDDDLYFQWLESLKRRPGEETIIGYFVEIDPEVYQEYLAQRDRRQEAFNLSYFIDYLRVKKPDSYQVFKSRVLVPQQANLQEFVTQEHPDLLAEWQKDKEKGVFNPQGSLPNYINNNYQSDRVLEEARVVLANMGIKESHLPTGERGREGGPSQDRGNDCHCSISITNTGDPNENALIVYNDPEPVVEKKKGKVVRSKDYTRSANGAAHSIWAERFTKGKRENEVDTFSPPSYRTATLSMECVDDYGYECSGYCSGEIVAEAQYRSDLLADIHIAGGILAKKGTAVAVDSGKLTLITQGFTDSVNEVLFNKALGVEREYETEYNSEALLGLVKSAAGIATAIVSGVEGSTEAIAAGGDAVSSLVKNAAGLIKKEGKPSSVIDKSMLAHFSTSNFAYNIPFDIHATRTFKIESDARVHLEGKNGQHNSGLARVDSAYYLVVGAKDFSCSADVTTMPDEMSDWSYGRTNGSKTSATTIKNNISAFLDLEMNQVPDFSTGFAGEVVTIIPPQPPNAVCDVTPDLGINGLNATMDGTSSSDVDGTIISYQWLRYPGTIAEMLIGTGPTAPLVVTDAPKYFMGSGGIHLKVTDNSGMSDTSYCGHVRVRCIEVTGEPCPIPSYPAIKYFVAP